MPIASIFLTSKSTASFVASKDSLSASIADFSSSACLFALLAPDIHPFNASTPLKRRLISSPESTMRAPIPVAVIAAFRPLRDKERIFAPSAATLSDAPMARNDLLRDLFTRSTLRVSFHSFLNHAVSLAISPTCFSSSSISAFSFPIRLSISLFVLSRASCCILSSLLLSSRRFLAVSKSCFCLSPRYFFLLSLSTSSPQYWIPLFASSTNCSYFCLLVLRIAISFCSPSSRLSIHSWFSFVGNNPVPIFLPSSLTLSSLLLNCSRAAVCSCNFLVAASILLMEPLMVFDSLLKPPAAVCELPAVDFKASFIPVITPDDPSADFLNPFHASDRPFILSLNPSKAPSPCTIAIIAVRFFIVSA